MKVLVTFAVKEEFGPWQARHPFAAARRGEQTVYEARIGEAEVSVFLTGIGPKVAESNMIGLLTSRIALGEAFHACVSAGLAGALRPGYSAGDILAARHVCRKQGSATLPPAEVLAHGKCLELAGECGARIVERFRTADHLILTAAEKSLLGETADAVEMESFTVLTEASVWGIGGIAIRAVGDTAEENLPLDFNQALTPQGTISATRLASALLRRPAALPGLVRFAKQSRDAAIALADYLDRYIAALGKSVRRSEPAMEEEVAAT